ncbi:response regulator [Bradyrhizobium sp. BR13661]|uniref:response regulator n=2 Tax=Pseudomonadota TaxID=1224 RepID=UPI00247423D4|nr:response regulator [Bradyrhizobium sp. BR13661]
MSQKAVKILIVDGDPDLRRAVAPSLKSLGYHVMEAKNGPDRRSRARPNFGRFASPGMNGAEVAKVMRETRPNVAIVFASGYIDTAAIERAAANSAVLRKPFRMDELHAGLTEALASGRRY